MHSAIRKVSKREMKMAHEGMKEKGRKMQSSCHLQKNDPKEQLLSIPKCEKNSSHVHVKAASHV